MYVYDCPVKMHRAQILLDPAQERELKDVARSEGRSVSAVVRDLLARQLALVRAQSEESTRRHMTVIDRIRLHVDRAVESGESVAADVAAAIRQSRDERDDEILAGR